MTYTLSDTLKQAIAAYGQDQLIEAERLCRAILTAKADHFNALHILAVVQARRGLKAEALRSYDQALTIHPNSTEALANRGLTLHELGRFEEALASYDRAFALKPDHKYALSGLIDCTLKLCDWTRRDELHHELRQHVLEQKSSISPFLLLGCSEDVSLQLSCANRYVQDRIAVLPQPLWQGTIWRNDKIKVAYLSTDFRDHPVAHLSAELFELHNRNRFEIFGVSYGPDDNSEMRMRLVKAFDHFHDARSINDQDVAKLLNQLKVDIAVDLTGHTQVSHPAVLAQRPTPIQVSYLGFPATLGADFIDYIIADAIILPFDQQPYYTEHIVHLPDCYQVNDRQRTIAAHTPTRVEAGLPTAGFVFCCFNNNWKISPAVFDVWMRLLKATEGSVLWLSQTGDGAVRNLRRESEARGIDSARLIFAPRLQRLQDHLARHRLANLFLDTLPYNAHTTASDALWAGLPVLTCRGNAYPGRVAASLLSAVGLPELVTANLRDYEALALKLAGDPVLLTAIRAKLARNRDTYPLFNTERFARHIEAAYTTMWETWQRGERPRSFSVAPSARRAPQL